MDQNSDVKLADAMPILIKLGWLPTFDEFKKNPDKYRQRPDEILISVDQSTRNFRNQVQRQVYSWKDQYTFDSLEQIERVCKDEGYSPADLEMEPLVKPLNGTSKDGKVEIVIRFWPKDEWQQRGKVITDDGSR